MQGHAHRYRKSMLWQTAWPMYNSLASKCLAFVAFLFIAFFSALFTFDIFVILGFSCAGLRWSSVVTCSTIQRGRIGIACWSRLQQRQQTCCLPSICVMDLWQTWCRGKKSNTKLLCVENKRQVPRTLWPICWFSTWSIRLKLQALFI